MVRQTYINMGIPTVASFCLFSLQHSDAACKSKGEAQQEKLKMLVTTTCNAAAIKGQRRHQREYEDLETVEGFFILYLHQNCTILERVGNNWGGVTVLPCNCNILGSIPALGPFVACYNPLSLKKKKKELHNPRIFLILIVKMFRHFGSAPSPNFALEYTQ